QTAEELKLEIGSAYPMEEEVQAEIRGRDMVSGLPKTVVLTSEEIRQALEEPVSQIIDAVKETLDRTPPELASDIMDRGIMLADPPHRLLRRIGGRRPARLPAGVPGGDLADPGRREPRAQARARPVRLVRRHARRQEAARPAARAGAPVARRGARRRGGAAQG